MVKDLLSVINCCFVFWFYLDSLVKIGEGQVDLQPPRIGLLDARNQGRLGADQPVGGEALGDRPGDLQDAPARAPGVPGQHKALPEARRRLPRPAPQKAGPETPGAQGEFSDQAFAAG